MSPCSPFDRKARRTILVIASLTCSLALLQPNLTSGQQFGFPVQLPTTSVFSVNTTVSVPDGGSISLGGNSGSAWSSTRSGGPFRPFGNRAIGGTQFASNASVHVQIISLAEMEADLLSQLPSDRSLEDYARLDRRAVDHLRAVGLVREAGGHDQLVVVLLRLRALLGGGCLVLRIVEPLGGN